MQMRKSLRETASIAAEVIAATAADTATVANPIYHHPRRTRLTVQDSCENEGGGADGRGGVLSILFEKLGKRRNHL
jgi:hypothetical protein